MTREERELSIEYLEKIKKDYIEGNAYERHPLPEYYAIENAIKALEQKPKWIPVSEKLPEENGGYLVTVKRGYVTTALWVGNAENWKEVTAWMPLPEPYEGGE